MEYLQLRISLVEFLRGSFLYHENGYEMSVKVQIFPLTEREELENVMCSVCEHDSYTRVSREFLCGGDVDLDDALDGVFRMVNTENDTERKTYAHLWCYMRIVRTQASTSYTMEGLDYIPLLCYSCSKWIKSNPHMIEGYRTIYTHQKCFVTCEGEGCEQEFSRGNESRGELNGESFAGCDDCLHEWVSDNDGVACSECSTYILVDDSTWEEAEELSFCESCASQRRWCDYCQRNYWRNDRNHHSHADDYLREPQDNPYLIFHGEGSYHLGFELETEFDEDSQDIIEPARFFTSKVAEDIAFLKSDGSLTNGFEIVSHPMTLDWARKEFPFNIVDSLRQNHNAVAWDSQNCGFHVHISRTAFDNDPHLFRFCKFFTHNVSFLTAFAGRHSTSYAAYDSNGNFESSAKHLKNKVKGYESSRYQAVNTTNEATVEVRIFRGTLRKDRILANLSLVQSLVEFTRDMSTPDVAKGSLTWANFIVYTGSHKETYPELWQKIEQLTPTRNNREN